jgi:uncharacterized membrane protein YphA (DoxX/SURF4 family)
VAAVFAVAGVAKLMDRPGARQAVGAFGVPDTVVAPVAVLLPIAELAVAVALLITAAAVGGAVGALVLLAGFIVGITINLAKGRQPDCRCFGQLHSAPVGWKTLARNAALAAAVAFVVAEGPGASLSNWSSGLTTLEWVTLLVAIALAAAFAHEGSQLVARWRRSRHRPDPTAGSATVIGPSSAGLPIGSRAPDFALPGGHGEVVTLKNLLASARPVLLIFVDPGCGSCTALMPEVEQWQVEHASNVTMAVVSRGPLPDPSIEVGGISNMGLQQDHEIGDAYRYGGPPGAVLIGADGLIASPMAAGPDAVRRLVHSAVRSRVIMFEDGGTGV